MEASVQVKWKFICNWEVALMTANRQLRKLNDRERHFACKGTNSEHSEETHVLPDPAVCSSTLPMRGAEAAAGANLRHPAQVQVSVRLAQKRELGGCGRPDHVARSF